MQSLHDDLDESRVSEQFLLGGNLKVPERAI